MVAASKFFQKIKNTVIILKFLIENQSKFRRILLGSGLTCAAALFLYKLCLKYAKNFPKSEPNKKTKSNPTLDKQFFHELNYLRRIMFPHLFSKQSFLLFIHTLTLICRTFLSIYVAKLEGLLVRNIVQKNFLMFAKKLIQWLLIAVPATTCNSLIRYLECKLDLELKTQLVNRSHKFYFDKQVYYKIALKQSDECQVDQNLTEDIDRLTNLFVHLYSSLTKPLLDIILITATLIGLAKSKNVNYVVPSLMALVVIVLTGLLIRKISPKFGKMAADVAKQKGYLRFLYGRIQTNSEEIAFYAGEKTESNLINKNYKLLKKKQELVHNNKFWYIIVEQFLLKYVWSAAGLSMISMPLLLSEKYSPKTNLQAEDEAAEISQRTEEFTMAKNLLSSGADAVERVMTSYKELTELSGYTRRVYEMFKLFETESKNSEQPIEIKSGLESNKLPKGIESGIVSESDTQNSIIVEDISVVTPNGEVIVPSLSIKIEHGMNLLITGPNGCGKSSLFRILSGLWPLKKGLIQRPKLKDMFYVPQRPYLAIGTLRDQIIYPDRRDDMLQKGIADADLMNIMEIVNLTSVVTREGGLDAVSDWKDVLSGGEKQRLGLSRIFYHRPKFAFLDECTSAISIDVEGKIYHTAINDYKITLLTIAHRYTLWQYHNYILLFDGIGKWRFDELNNNLDNRLNLKQEKDNLEKILLTVPTSKERLQELCNILGEGSIALE
uniref:ATP-binding cassette transporter subfamily D member 2 n=1 Tax=Brachionus rotundiformis TaxID=96890 RepID=A0A7H9SKZ3_9BILA|nr:ATP-binding cassette transporter subfamily D member 2 [Brachionus rotundiformis]